MNLKPMIDARGIRRPLRVGLVTAAAWLLVAPAWADEVAGAAECAASEPAAADARAGCVEEVVVTAEELRKGAVPSATIIAQTYNVQRRGERLYNERRYQEALPYLVMAAKRGFKRAQAMAGDIYLHGRGGAERDLEAGMGWLGVAARPQTATDIQTYFRQAMAELPTDVRPRVEDAVARYRAQWSSRDWRVSCRRSVAGKSPVGMGLMSLRLNKRMDCAFTDWVTGDSVFIGRHPTPLQFGAGWSSEFRRNAG